ncbi:MAG: DUF1579 domain-containing protein [Calditrichaeota bacterium]|nr:DUF1579 domain-containing protein [Calditrichota bacterium]MCB9369088.1 DUF1579 domain-containing protein [Calditrichota bacterium]
MKKLLIFIAAALLALTPLYAQDNGMSEDEMMKKWMEISSPGPQHELLAKTAGEWNTEIKFWLEPGADPMVSNGMQTCEVINGGRVINEISHSEMMGMPFEGHGMTGYDNFRKKYWSTWTDNMATSMMYMEGTSDDDGKTITYNTTMDDPMIGEKDQPVKFVYRWVDDDKHILESWHDVGTPKEYKMMEITYTRKQ